ncbi:MAG: PFIG00823557: AC2 (Proteasome assembly chaperone) family, partial [uncultured Nocardioides sp.]
DRDRRPDRPGGPRGDRRLRGLERRRRVRLAGDRPPDGRVGRQGRRRDRPRGVLRLPGQPSPGHDRRERPPSADLADHPDRRRLAAQPGARHHPGPRDRAQHAVAPVLRGAPGRLRRPRRRARRHAGRAARRHPAHPAHPRHRHGHRAGAGRPAEDRAVDVRGPDRDRGRVPGRLRAPRHPVGVLLGRRPALRGAAAVPQGDPRARRADRGPARRQHPARRPPGGGPRLGAGCRRAGRGGRGHRGVHPGAGGDPRHHRPARGLGRGDRARVRALPEAEPGRGAGV